MGEIQDAYEARQRELDHFARQEEINRRQEYDSIERAMQPAKYGEKLDYLCGRIFEGTGDWLIQDPDVNKWLGATNDSPKVIWLRGIPGAGKINLLSCPHYSCNG
jgi:hypothetical protein